jgi:hypothetical protein
MRWRHGAGVALGGKAAFSLGEGVAAFVCVHTSWPLGCRLVGLF